MFAHVDAVRIASRLDVNVDLTNHYITFVVNAVLRKVVEGKSSIIENPVNINLENSINIDFSLSLN